MATIEERTKGDGKKVYRVKIRIKGTPVQTASFDRKTDAKRWATQTEAAIREGRYFKTTEAQKRTVAQMIDRYINEVLPGKSKNMVHTANQRRQLLWWRDTLGEYVLADLSAPMISECRDKLSQGITHLGKPRSPSTVNRFISAFSHCLTIATNEWEWLDDSPMRKVRRKQENKGRVRWLDNDERVRLLDACKKSRLEILYPIVTVALSTGSRKSEIMTLTWDAVDLDRQQVTLYDTKNGENRIVPLIGVALEEMRRLSKVRRIDTKLCFPSCNGSKPFDIRKAWAEAMQAAEVENFHFHDLRHSCASYLVMNGANLREVGSLLGHKTAQMTMRYAHLSKEHMSDMVERMDNKIFGGDVEAATRIPRS